jgi:hypothetical protein
VTSSSQPTGSRSGMARSQGRGSPRST